jgi:hypothetical protein
MIKLCIKCRTNKAELPDREVMGRPIKKICRECHRKRLEEDLKRVLTLSKKPGITIGYKLYE